MTKSVPMKDRSFTTSCFLEVYTVALLLSSGVMMSCFQAIVQIRKAIWITASRQIIFMMILILILPLPLGVNGVWISVPLAELFL